MKKFIRVVTLLSMTVMAMLAFVGCSENEQAYINAVLKTQGVSSMEAKSDIVLHFEASGFPASEQATMDQAAAVLDNLKISLNQKLSRNAAKTVAKAQMDGTVNIGGMSLSGQLWVDVDASGSKAVVKEVFKLPELLKMYLPQEARGKDYIVLDPVKMSQTQGVNAPDFSQLMRTSVELQEKLIHIISEYSKQYNPEVEIITLKGTKNINGENLPLYEIKIDDRTFKELLRYTFNDFIQKPEAMELVSEFLMMAAESSGNTAAKSEIEAVIADMKANLPAVTMAANEVLDAFEGVKLIDGITANVAINKAGYIVYESGSINFNLDFGAIVDAAEKLSPESAGTSGLEDGVFKIGIDYTTEISRINEDVKITMPVLTASNSIDFEDLISSSVSQPSTSKPNPQATVKEIGVFMNGKKLKLDSAPKMVNGRILVPVKGVFEALGAEVKWDAKTKTVSGIKGSKKIVMVLNSKRVTVNGVAKALDVPAASINGRTYVPLRFVGESFGAEVIFDAKANAVMITTK